MPPRVSCVTTASASFSILLYRISVLNGHFSVYHRSYHALHVILLAECISYSNDTIESVPRAFP